MNAETTLEQTQRPDQAATPRSSLASLWRTVNRLDKGKMNAPILALRNGLAVAIPLGLAIAFHYPAAGAAVASGALNVSYSDGVDPYSLRARRMLTWSLLGALASFSGSACGPHPWASIALTMSWAFVAGLLVSISTRAGDLGLNTLVAVIVFSARGPSTAGGAFGAGLLVLLGGLLQTASSLLFWPVHRYEPERRVIADAFDDLAKAVVSNDEDTLADPLVKSPSSHEQDTLTALGRDRSLEGERLRLLLDQTERIRLSANLLRRLESQAAYGSMSGEQARDTEQLVHVVDQVLINASDLLREVAVSLRHDAASPELASSQTRADTLAGQVGSASGTGMLGTEISAATETLTGQLRVAAGLATRSTPEGSEDYREHEAAKPWHLQVQNWLDTLLSNLTLRSPACRHGVRMALFCAVAEGLSHGINWQRSYWIPMTVAVILKPDFTTTFSRGLLRLGGTLLGLTVATALYHAIPAGAAPELMLVCVFTFVLRRYGPANYGIFSVAISGLIVFLMAATGIAPAEVVVQRGVNTLAGGCLAMLAYAVWPTWERRHVADALAEMLDATRLYFQAVMQEFEAGGQANGDTAREARQVWRRARTGAEASVDRVASEPGISSERIGLLQSMLASSHVVVHAVMSLEAGLQQAMPEELSSQRAADAFRQFAHDVEFTLYFLAATVRGSTHARGALPALREDHRKLVEAAGLAKPAASYLLTETDRLTVSLNTLREQLLRFVH